MKMKKLLLTCGVTLVLFVFNSVSVSADPTGGIVTPNSYIKPITVQADELSE